MKKHKIVLFFIFGIFVGICVQFTVGRVLLDRNTFDNCGQSQDIAQMFVRNNDAVDFDKSILLEQKNANLEGAVIRLDYPLLDLQFSEKDQGVILINYKDGDRFYMSTQTQSFERCKDVFYVETFAAGKGTTPKCIVSIYKNNVLVKEIPVMRICFAGLEKDFYSVDRK
ncbi:MAG: hypothetical protein IJD83_01435 [Clostridia bacterium]|nr:hypothetical protein [Clostridia bacterium]